MWRSRSRHQRHQRIGWRRRVASLIASAAYARGIKYRRSRSCSAAYRRRSALGIAYGGGIGIA